MLKIKMLKKLTVFVMMFSMIFSMVFATSFSVLATTTEEGSEVAEEVTEEVTSVGTETSPTNQMLHFVMKVRWGNVIGDPTNITESNFDGSVDVTNNARVSLERTLLFERHNSNDIDSNATLTCETCGDYVADKIISRKNPVSWNSLIYGHWDGVKVLVSSPASDDVVIETSEGTVTMTAQELYDLSAPFVYDTGEGREIVIKTYPIKDPKYFLKVIWGKTTRTDYALKGEADEIEINAVMVENTIREIIKNKLGKDISVYDASGYFQINDGGALKLIRALRFEGTDKITASSTSKIEWTSHVAQGVDGILTKLDLDADSLNDSDTVTLNFTEVGWSKDFNIVDLYHNRITTETIKEDYGVILQVWRKPNRSMIRIKDKAEVYMVEDGVKQWIPSPEVLTSQGLTFDNVEVIEQDEADTYGDGEEICYADGTIVREEGADEVYVIADGEKKHITDPTAFSALGYSWKNVVKVRPGALGFYRLRTAMRTNSVHPEGALIREDGTSKVYLVEGGKKKPISTQKIFNARNLDWSKVLVIRKEQMAKFQLGANLKYPDGALVNVDGKTYIMDQGEKRWIRSGDDLTNAGYNATDVITVDDPTEVSDLNATDEGSDIVADDVL